MVKSGQNGLRLRKFAPVSTRRVRQANSLKGSPRGVLSGLHRGYCTTVHTSLILYSINFLIATFQNERLRGYQDDEVERLRRQRRSRTEARVPGRGSGVRDSHQANRPSIVPGTRTVSHVYAWLWISLLPYFFRTKIAYTMHHASQLWYRAEACLHTIVYMCMLRMYHVFPNVMRE